MLARLKRRLIQWRFRSRALAAGLLRAGSGAYRRRTVEELDHYSGIHEADPNRSGLEPAPPVWEELQRRAQARIRSATGHDVTGYVANRLRARGEARMLSLGSGPGGVELAIAREAPAAEILCLDLNRDAVTAGEQAARSESLHVRFEEADLNTAPLAERAFDVVFCHASLHHVLELESLAGRIRRSLRDGGELVVVDIITRNGYRMWPETRRVVEAIWKTLPERLRLNHTGYLPEKSVDQRIWEWDTRASGMECLRSEEILPVLRANFETIHEVGFFSICRRFFDTMYGPNYDLGRPLDRSIVDWIWELDCDLLARGELRPETFFGVFR